MRNILKNGSLLKANANKKVLKMKAKFIPLYIAALSISSVSCKKFLEADPPKTFSVSEVVFQDEKIATSATVGMYTSMNGFNSQFASGFLSILMSITADDYYYGASSYDAYKNNDLLPSTSYLDRMWSQPYAIIGQANSVIEGVANSSLSASVKTQLTSEAKFVRAFCYFYLVNMFNKVPLVIDTDVNKNKTLPQSTKQEVYNLITQDLIDAVAGLGDAYASAERVRPNKKAAQALLARVYLYTQKWELAESTASLVIADNRYKIPTDLTTVFTKTSEEAIWQLLTVNVSTTGVNTWEGFSMVPNNTTVNPLYRIYQTTLDAFAGTDKRKLIWTTEQVFGGVPYRYPSKYKYRTATPVVEYNTVLRLAEQYLIRAEARANIGTAAKISEAVNDLNVLRSRANAQPSLSSNLSKADALLAVENERRFELLGEWGHRWFDLVRTNRAVQVLSAKTNGFTASDMLIPIHEEILKTNTNLKPND
ncbi:RagB/SusD family nutrient uptake outer membrane protein [Pedobacter ureilyticus]|uniref:RagB/SusD family nutrient uptake outer membrane protein n=1 Tax=Pedobacter ureilyticus TaxID=1393051 RepID=A0ABW9JBG1_9SPHI|nr:RagB/SusD family nutrient uptake outer membrane protein [Pedobacter helvus]